METQSNKKQSASAINGIGQVQNKEAIGKQTKNQAKDLTLSSTHSYATLLYPIIAGFFGFAATVIGSHFFKLSHPYYYIGLGILLFLLSNHLLYKFTFNSYHSNGSTVTTVLVFTSQVVSMAIYKIQSLEWKWIVGVIFILIGTVLIEPKKVYKNQNRQIAESEMKNK